MKRKWKKIKVLYMNKMNIALNSTKILLFWNFHEIKKFNVEINFSLTGVAINLTCMQFLIFYFDSFYTMWTKIIIMTDKL